MDTWRRARRPDRAYGRDVIGERRAVQAFLGAKAISRGSMEVELRESPPTSDPRSGRPLFVPPVVVLWIEERPVAVRVRNIVAISRFPPEPRLVSMLGPIAWPPGSRSSACPRPACGGCSRIRRAPAWPTSRLRRPLRRIRRTAALSG
jgi:hypothetical protein